MSRDYTRISLTNEGDFCRVTINRPGDRNSIDSILMAELLDMLENVENSKTRAIIFSGAGDTYFIGGADGVEMMQCDPEQARRFSSRIQNLFNRMEASPLILVAAINGLCFGGGFEFTLACDLRVASETARIGLPEVKVGIIPGGGGTQRLPALVGTGLAMEMILSGKLYAGRNACDLGLVHRVVPSHELVAESRKILDPILRNPQHALSQAKRAVRSYRGGGLTEGLKNESDTFSECFKNDFFVQLMQSQLREGSLKTTVSLPSRVDVQQKEEL